MATYIASFQTTTSASLAVKANTFGIRIVKLELVSNASSTNPGSFGASKYLSSTLSGGTTVVPSSLRDSASSSTTTAKSGSTPSGTAISLAAQFGISGTVSYQFPSDLILNPGNVFSVSFSGSGGFSFLIIIYFDEEHLARSA